MAIGPENLYPVFVAVVVVVGVVGGVYSLVAKIRRRNAFQALAGQLHLRYCAEDSGIPDRYSFLDTLSRGHSRYAANVLTGEYRGYDVLAFDFHYTTGSGKSQQHHRLGFFMLHLPRSFQELKIYPENFLAKIGQTLGFEDVDFESAAFSDAFTVRAADKKFAYDFCHARMMEYLLQHRSFAFEIEGECLAMGMEKLLAPEEVMWCLDRLIEIRELMPAYVLADDYGLR